MGCTSSKEFEKQAKREGWEAPLNRTQSMPVTSTLKYAGRDDSFHVVALTSSTYGILKVEAPDQEEDQAAPPKVKAEVDAVSEMYQKMKDFEIPEVMEPKPWSEMSFNLPRLNLQLKPKSPRVGGGLSEEPETINMWELMDGLDDDFSPFPRISAAAAPFKFRHLEKSQSMFAVRTVEEVDAAVASKVDAISDSGGGGVVAQTGKLAKTTSFGVHGGAGKENAKPNSLSALMAQRSISNSPMVSAKSGPSPWKESLPASQVPAASTKPANFTGKVATAEDASPGRRRASDIPVPVSTPKHCGMSGCASAPLRPGSAVPGPGSNSKPKAVPAQGIPPLTLDSGFIMPSLDRKPSSRGVSPKSAGRIPPLSLDSSYEHISLPQSTGGVHGAVKVSPKLAERLAAFTVAASRPEVGTARPVSAVKVDVQHAGRNQSGLNDGGPEVTYVNNFPSSPEEEPANPSSPLFDPDLLASFEKALEQISEDDWYAVRTGGETTSSGSTTDVESPVKRGGGGGGGRGSSTQVDKSCAAPEVNAKGNKISLLAPDSQTKASPQAAEVKNVRKLMSSKVAPVAGDDKVMAVKAADPLDKLERKCPPGGEGRVVLYVTSLRGIRKTFEDCCSVRMILQSFCVLVDERDVAMHSEFRQELKEVMGKPVPVPRVFIKGRYVGGHEEVAQLHEDGVLSLLMEGLPAEKSRMPCDGCGGVRFVPCMECSGSCKVVTDDDEIRRCPHCNENGLIRCPICF